MRADPSLRDRLRRLLESQCLGVLVSQSGGQPHPSLVAFAVDADLRRVVFATPRATRKYTNLKADGRVALLVDDRSNRATDIQQAMAATAYGLAVELSGDERRSALDLYLEKNPHLREFVESPTCALVAIAVRSYSVVDQFQHVVDLPVGP